VRRWSRFYDRYENVIGMSLLVLCYVLIAVTGATYIFFILTGRPIY
jgi:hypothetical protein